MVLARDGKVTPEAWCFTFTHADELAAVALRTASAPLVIIDMTAVHDLTTAALAHLVSLRLALLDRGRDLRLTGLTGRPLALYHLTRMSQVLPAIPQPDRLPTSPAHAA